MARAACLELYRIKFGPESLSREETQSLSSQHLVDLLDPETYQLLSAAPKRLVGIINASPPTKLWIIDEIQRIPALLPLIHQLLESGQNLSFALTGSSARKLRRFSSDLLVGRALECHLHPFFATELGADFDLEKALQIGLLPLVWTSANQLGTLKSYLSLYTQTEVQAEGLVKSLPSFSRFLEAVSFSQGSLLNFSAIGRDCGVDRKTIQSYVEILEDLLVAFRLPVFAKKAKRQLISHENFIILMPVFTAPLDQKAPWICQKRSTGQLSKRLSSNI